MWVPAPMTRFLLATHIDDLTEILEFFGQIGKFHLVDFSTSGLREPRYSKTYQNLLDYEEQIRRIIEYFEIEVEKPITRRAVDATEVEDEVGKFLEKFQSELGEKQKRLQELKEREENLNILSEILVLLPESDVEIEDLRESGFFKMKGGVFPSEEEENLYESVESLDIMPFTREPYEGMIPSVVFYYRDAEEQVERVLKNVRFRELKEFNKLEGSILSLKDEVETNFWEIKEERTGIRGMIMKMGEDIEERICKYKNQIDVSLKELEWVNKTARSEKVFFLDAYVPCKEVPEVKEMAEDRDLFILEEEEVKRNNEKSDKVPTKFNNPFFFRPFEFLVKTYDIPLYRGVDPTVPTSISFILLFGIMFGDLGHGLVLILGGVGIYFLKLLRKYSLLPIAMGLSSCVFGVLFGEFFGQENFFGLKLQPVWFSPFQDPERAMLLAVYLGIGFVVTGFLIKLIENIMKSDRDELLLSGEGLPGFVFYVSTIFLVFSVIRNAGPLIISTEVAVVALSALIIGLGKPLKKALRKGLDTNQLLVSLGELVHISLAMISNTLSFIRVAAFNIGHIILTLSILTIAEMINEMIGGGGYSTLVLGNLFVIVLEGMIVFIQGMRLEYYEFYSRFFEKGGKLYNPIQI